MATRTIHPPNRTPPELAIIADIYAHRDSPSYPPTIFVVTTAPSLPWDILVECKDFTTATKEYNLLFAEICQEIVVIFSRPAVPEDEYEPIPTNYRLTKRWKFVKGQLA